MTKRPSIHAWKLGLRALHLRGPQAMRWRQYVERFQEYHRRVERLSGPDVLRQLEWYEEGLIDGRDAERALAGQAAKDMRREVMAKVAVSVEAGNQFCAIRRDLDRYVEHAPVDQPTRNCEASNEG